jgi:hypothetical protein
MRALAITAVLGVLVALPLLFSRRQPEVAAIKAGGNPKQVDSNLRYDVDDFLTQ